MGFLLWQSQATILTSPFVYIKVVSGEFDEMLSWPCKEKVRVTPDVD